MAGLQLGPWPFPPRPEQQGARQPEEAVHREQALSRLQPLPPAATQGRAPRGLGVAFPGEEMAQRGGAAGRAPWPSPQGCWLLCGQCPTQVLLRVNHLERDL